MELSATTIEQKEQIQKFLNKHKTNIGETENLDVLYSEFEDFLTRFCNLTVSDSDKYTKRELGCYFNPLDEYFKLWINARCVYATNNLR